MCRKRFPYGQDPDRRFFCELIVIVPFRASHPSFLSETMQLGNFKEFDKLWYMVGNDAPSIHTRIADWILWLHNAQTVFIPRARDLLNVPLLDFEDLYTDASSIYYLKNQLTPLPVILMDFRLLKSLQIDLGT